MNTFDSARTGNKKVLSFLGATHFPVVSMPPAVATGIIPFCHMTTGIADFPVGAEFSTTAVLDIIHDLVLSGMESVFSFEWVAVLSEDISERRAGCLFIR